jgi:uncharacterized protein (TIGR00661 family)
MKPGFLFIPFNKYLPMKIFYAVQATGNGHISRAMELLPWLQRFGTVDIFLSGDNSHLELNAPVKYRSKGISLFYTAGGGIDYWKMMRHFEPLRVRREIRSLPVEQYDLVLNDFDFMTSAACARKKVPSIHFGHQASFQSAAAPRPLRKDVLCEWLMKHYVKAAHHVGLHFEPYDDFIFPAVVKQAVLDAEPSDGGHITVYLPSYSERYMEQFFSRYPRCPFQVFSKEATTPRISGNIRFLPVSSSAFNHSLIHCHGIITGGGFETPAEALHLGKKIISIPIRGQYEQQCNAAALKKMGVLCLSRLDGLTPDVFDNWMQAGQIIRMDYSRSIPQVIDRVRDIAESRLPEFEVAASIG